MSLVVQAPFRGLNNGWSTISDALCAGLSPRITDFLRKHAGADLLIVTGDAGTGKTSFIQTITGADLYVGSTLKSGTTNTALVPAVIAGKRFLFLDMPGFNTTDFDDWEVFSMLMRAMTTVQAYVRFRGVLFFDSVNQVRLTPAAHKILTWLFHFCGSQFMPNVTIVTTKWAGLDEDGIHEKLARFETWKASELFRLFLSPPGARVYHHGLTREGETFSTLHCVRMVHKRKREAIKMIMDNYYGESDLTLRIYDEISNGATVEETSAGRWLRSPEIIGSLRSGSEAINDQDVTVEVEDISSPSAEATINQGANSTEEQFDGTYDDRTNPPSPDADQESQQGGFFGGFTYEDAKPWLRLLLHAVKFYVTSSFQSPGQSRDFDEFDDDFDFDNSYLESHIFGMGQDEGDDMGGHYTAEDDADSSFRCVAM